MIARPVFFKATLKTWLLVSMVAAFGLISPDIFACDSCQTIYLNAHENAESTEGSDPQTEQEPSAPVLPEGARVLEKPMTVMFFATKPEAEGMTRENGRLLAHNDDGFQFDPGFGVDPRWVPWSEVSPQYIFLIQLRLYRDRYPDGDGDADWWLRTGARLSQMKDGEKYAKLSFARAKEIDPAASERIEAAIEAYKKENPVIAAEAEKKDSGEKVVGEDPAKPSEKKTKQASGPANLGAINKQAWGEMTPEAREAAIERHKKWTDEKLEAMNIKLGLLETKYFLFYTDIPTAEAREWGNLLDNMHERLLRMFGMPNGQNIWLGKGCIYVFREEADYHRFMMQSFRINSVGSAGMCVQHGSGDVHIAFYRQPNRWDFAAILVHESVHGFIHRYRSPARIPSWLNEGLAEIISQRLVPQSKWVERKRAQAKATLREQGSFMGMFEAGHIAGFQYGMAADLVDFMIDQNNDRFVKFFNGVKDGKTWRESMDENYLQFDRILLGYGQSISAKNLKP